MDCGSEWYEVVIREAGIDLHHHRRPADRSCPTPQVANNPDHSRSIRISPDQSRTSQPCKFAISSIRSQNLVDNTVFYGEFDFKFHSSIIYEFTLTHKVDTATVTLPCTYMHLARHDMSLYDYNSTSTSHHTHYA